MPRSYLHPLSLSLSLPLLTYTTSIKTNLSHFFFQLCIIKDVYYVDGMLIRLLPAENRFCTFNHS